MHAIARPQHQLGTLYRAVHAGQNEIDLEELVYRSPFHLSESSISERSAFWQSELEKAEATYKANVAPLEKRQNEAMAELAASPQYQAFRQDRRSLRSCRSLLKKSRSKLTFDFYYVILSCKITI